MRYNISGLCLVIFCAVSTINGQQSERLKVINDTSKNRSEINIEFEGNKVFSSQQLLDVMKQFGKRNQSTCPSSEKGYQAERFDSCLRSIIFFMRSHGYLRAVAGEPKLHKSKRGLKITVPIDEGALYRLGEIKLEGATLFSPAQILGMLNVKKGDIADGDAIATWLYERLKKAYADRGYIQYTADPEPIYRSIPAGAQEGVVDFIVAIDEGQAFIIRSIKFEGNRDIPEDMLRREMLVRGGDVFNQGLFDESLKRLSQTGLVEEIWPQHVDMRWDNKSPKLDIIIHVKEREHR